MWKVSRARLRHARSAPRSHTRTQMYVRFFRQSSLKPPNRQIQEFIAATARHVEAGRRNITLKEWTTKHKNTRATVSACARSLLRCSPRSL